MRAILIFLLLSACGGGDPEPEQTHTEKADPPNCAASGVCK